MGDGFYTSSSNGKTSWNYASSKPPSIPSNNWVPWDQAPADQRASIEQRGIRAKTPTVSTQLVKPVPTFGQIGTPNTNPLSMARNLAPKQTVSGMPTVSGLQTGGEGGFLGGTNPSQNKILDLLRTGGSYLGKHPDLLLSGLGLVGDLKAAKNKDKLTEEAINWQKQQDLLRQQKADQLSTMVQGLQVNRPDLSDTFADPSNPFYKGRVRPLGQ